MRRRPLWDGGNRQGEGGTGEVVQLRGTPVLGHLDLRYRVERYKQFNFTLLLFKRIRRALRSGREYLKLRVFVFYFSSF